MELKTKTEKPRPPIRVMHRPFVPGVQVRLLDPAPGHIALGVGRGSKGRLHATAADETTGLVRVRFDSGQEFWCDPDSLDFLD